MLILMAHGRSREEAYRIVQEAAMAALEGRGRFRDLLGSAGVLSPQELEACFDLTPYLAHVDAILQRAGVPKNAPAGPPEARAAAAPSGAVGGDRAE
jgi:adenylosuccinate lyase